ncbi:conidiation-specific protein Con-10 [Aspergillus sclerotialis]|uniref:Conidiation-specific protein Con-10 n=1 Tax=Aspergillus sclerotialis TaxID=2070753 RepID=A0A3A2ZGZ3_9EURO|nr:conidiation-specific protein Con-10 [Aspergillus sclerotialis]
MQRYLFRAGLINHPATWNLRRLAIETHPNPGNFANRSKEEMAKISRKGGRKGGKHKGVGGFHEMDPKKQHAIASRGGHAANKAAVRREGSSRGTSAAEGTPSSAPPGFNETATS